MQLLLLFLSRRSSLLYISVVLRLSLIVYGEWQDAHMDVRYTDIDYLVFSDAAALMAKGSSPFNRDTYRYSPLLAFLLLPNHLFHPCWGKLLFSAADLLVGQLMYQILKQRGIQEKTCIVSMAVWLFNPFTFTVATRGNCEAVVCSIVLWVLYCILNGHLVEAAIWYGIVVHFRIYPIIYSLPILMVLDDTYVKAGKKFSKKLSLDEKEVSAMKSIKYKDGFWTLTKRLLNRNRIAFTFVSGAVFSSLTGLSYVLYGSKFLHEALLYHLTRTDPRHNFSIYFYHIYLHHTFDFTLIERLLSFVPQLLVQLILAIFFAKDLPFCTFAQTVAFVSFNKVITAQYFVWYFCLLPLILPWTRMHFFWKGAFCTALWTGTQMHWLGWAYALEYQGRNVFLQLWLSSIIFFWANIVVLAIFISHHSYCPLVRFWWTSKSNHQVKAD